MCVFMSFIIGEDPADSPLDVLPMSSVLGRKCKNRVLDTPAYQPIVPHRCQLVLKHFLNRLETKG